MFHDLSSEEIEQIVDLMMDRLRVQLTAQGIGITLTEGARSFLAKAGFDPALGARPLRRAIQRNVEDPLSEQILAGQWKSGDMVEVHLEDDAITFRKGEGPFTVPTTPTKEAAAKPTVPARSTRRAGGRSGGRASGGAAGE